MPAVAAAPVAAAAPTPAPGAFDDTWLARFRELLTRLQLTPGEQEVVLHQLATSGWNDAQLQEAYDQLLAALPGWNESFERRFGALDLPEELLRELRAAGHDAATLDRQLQGLEATLERYRSDGRLDRLLAAKATPDERWSVMLQGLDGDAFDEAVQRIANGHVSGWQRLASFAVNLVPGVYALQYLSGKDWITGERIDRSNPLNVVGAVVSGFAGFNAVRGAIQGVQGLAAAGRAASSTMQLAGPGATSLSGAVRTLRAAGVASPLAQGSLDAIEAAGLAAKFARGLRVTDYVKSAIPLVNRFGEAGRLASVGRGYWQGMQLTAGAAALVRGTGSGAIVDPSVRRAVLGDLRAGMPISDALAGAGRSSDAVLSAGQVVRGHEAVGFLQGSVGRAVDGARLLRGSGNYSINPFGNTQTIASTSRPDVLSLGRSVNFASRGGLAQGLGATSGVLLADDAAAAAAALRSANPLMRSEAAVRLSGLAITDDAQRMLTLQHTARWGQELGVAGSGGLRSLMHLGSAGARSTRRVAGIVEHGGAPGYRFLRHAGDVGRRLGGYVAPPLIGGSVVGLTGRQVQPGWEYVKHRGEVLERERTARDDAVREARELQQRAQGQLVDGSTPAVPAVVLDPVTGLFIDPATGLMADPTTGAVYDQHGHVVSTIETQQEHER